MSAAIPDFSIFSQSEIEEILAANKALYLQLNTAMSADGGSVTRRQLADVNAIIGACIKALRKLDPDTYGKPPPRHGQAVVNVRID